MSNQDTLAVEFNRPVETYRGFGIVYNMRWREYRVTDPVTVTTFLFKTLEEARAKVDALTPAGPILRRLRALRGN